MLVEVWFDYGDDGHTDYYHGGYRFIPHSLYVKEMKYIWCGHLPTCMTWDYSAEEYPVDAWKEHKKLKEDWEKRSNG